MQTNGVIEYGPIRTVDNASLDTARARTLRRLTWVMRSGIAISLAGVIWSMWPAQQADASFRPRVAERTFTERRRPRVVIDQGHANVHTADGRFAPFARLMAQDGLRVLASEGTITPEALRNVDVFVTANALGYKGMAQQLANTIGLERLINFDVNAFSDREIAVLTSWVSDGGRALIVADHRPAADASKGLAAAFGVEMTTWWAEDAKNSDTESGNPATLVFSRDAGLLGDHPILNGRNDAERINRVMTFTGQALKPGPNGAVLLMLSPSAREYPFRFSREAQGRSAAGLAQAVALEFGKGRVVVIGEAAALTAQRIETPGAQPFLMGMNKPGTDNQQFVLNVMHWLMRVL
jgi:hypothetical protein